MNITQKELFETLTDALLVRAPAKINLSLLIAGKRPDGFHEIETIMAKINFYDELLVQRRENSGIEVVSTGPYWAPQGKENLIYKACELILQQCGKNAGIKITLTKNIPAGSGLGSASSDAAATLLALNKILKLKLNKKTLNNLASQLGSDVPFFLGGPLALCCGKGEKIRNLQKNYNFSAILILPEINASTEKVYENYKHDSTLYNKLKTQIDDAIKKNRIDLVSKMCANMLLQASCNVYNDLAEIKSKVEALGIGPLCLSGSGSAMFCIVENQNIDKALEYIARMENKVGCKSIMVSNNRW
ncbi:MAG: 4-(cytidine 5'-diphospho)-2-C-methyl-D-erythritol kinase [Planctomycetes bacterium]|nr:4-(cytidine 5'-diphospho)-2-C-methyl-D-erythritol kinase [Planctomycetota bacterium]